MSLRYTAVHGKALPINAAEFWKSFSQIWKPRARNGHGPETIGLAVSGGVDSMALATLCSNLPHITSELRFRAFVVDHGARNGSAEEAQAVSDNLMKRGIPTDVLRIEWPQGSSPSTSAKFESLARTYRFQTLGRACRDLDIQTLLVAHHEDDQVETVLMRMLTGRRRSALGGMGAISTIPECYGMHGVYHSGLLDQKRENTVQGDLNSMVPRSRGRNLSGKFVSHQSLKKTNPLTALTPLRFESGGIAVLRPLLQFNKERLRATCEAEGVAWFEDHTNSDPTITLRNAIRNTYANNSLPKALQKSSLLALSAKIALRNKDDLQKGQELARNMHLFKFEPHSGTLLAGFEPLPMMETPTGSEAEDLSYRRHIAAQWLRSVASLVTAAESIPVSSLGSAVSNVFPELSDQPQRVPEANFIEGGVHFKRVDRSDMLKSDVRKVPFSKKKKEKLLFSDKSTPTNRQWLLSRQPYHPAVAEKIRLTFPPTQADPQPGEWKLYDGRYWIRVFNRSPNAIVLRPFTEADSQTFDLKTVARLQLLRLLAHVAPSSIRRTLPAMVMVHDDGSERIISLPTLQFEVADTIMDLVDYEVRYKKVDDWVLERMKNMGGDAEEFW